MESNSNKIKVKVVIKLVDDNKENTSLSIDNKQTLTNLEDLLLLVSGGNSEEDIDKRKIVSMLKKFKKANESIADGMIDIEREDLFDGKMESLDLIEKIIKQISNT